MKRNTIFVVLILVFLLTSPLITSLKITKNNNSFEKTDLDLKIQQIIDKINETLVRNYLEYLVFEIGCRYTGTYGCEKAADYIYNQFESMGLETRYHDWEAWGNRWHPYYFESQNVEAKLIGTDPDYKEEIIFNAHYDTVKNTVGANDNSAGTVGVLVSAFVLSQFDFKRTIRFLSVSGEEEGLLGSFEYAKDLYEEKTRVLVDLNADGIGHQTSYNMKNKMRLSLTEDATWIEQVMQNLSYDYNLDFEIISTNSIDRYEMTHSDHSSFAHLGYEALAFWPGEWGGAYHEPGDNISNVNITYLTNFIKRIAATIAFLADTELEQPQAYIASPLRGKNIRGEIPMKNSKLTFTIPLIIDATNIYAEVKPGAHPIEKVEFYYGKRIIFTDTEKPYEYILNKRSIGLHTIKIVAYDTQGNNATDEMKILFFNLLKTTKNFNKE